MTRRRPLLVTLAALAIAASVLYVGLMLRRPVERPLAYWPIDTQALGVVVLGAPNLSCEIARVDETSAAVRIHAQCHARVIPVPDTSIAQKYVLQATLQPPSETGRYDGNGDLALHAGSPGRTVSPRARFPAPAQAMALSIEGGNFRTAYVECGAVGIERQRSPRSTSRPG